MSSTHLEQLRSSLELMERSELCVVSELDSRPRTTKQRVWQQHAVRNLSLEAQRHARAAMDVYQDRDGAFAAERESMRAGGEMLGAFYSALRQTQEYHARFPHLSSAPAQLAQREEELFAPLRQPDPRRVAFTGEEVFGKYLDLTAFHARFVNLRCFYTPQAEEDPGEPRPLPDYGDFLDVFWRFDGVDEKDKRADYRSYVGDLHAYLCDFFARTQPLVDLEALLAQAMEDFHAMWSRGNVPGWYADGPSADAAADMNGEEKSASASAPRELDLRGFHAAEELEALGRDRLKEALVAKGLKAGGTGAQRAERLFATKGLSWHEIPAKLKAKKPTAHATAPSNGHGGPKGPSTNDGRKALARLEYRIKVIVRGPLSEPFENTLRHLERKLTQTVEEKEAELRNEEEGLYADGRDDDMDEEDDDDAVAVYNPKNLPLGWDGKPIPYWLYKLHGLNQRFVCEICGNVTYEGRRQFDRHFREWRHSYGMKCLGIPNTKHFHDITSIEDAKALHRKLQSTVSAETWNQDKGEEFEDSQGNVLNKKTYTDLARMGML